MSFLLDGTVPAGLVVKFWGSVPFAPSISNKLHLHSEVDNKTVEITLEQFCEAVRRYLFSDEFGYELDNKISVFQLEDWTLVIDDEPFAIISPADFVFLVKYVFTNSNLDPNDFRESLVNELVFGDKKPKELESQKRLFEWLTNLQIGEGFLQIPEVKGSRRFLW